MWHAEWELAVVLPIIFSCSVLTGWNYKKASEPHLESEIKVAVSDQTTAGSCNGTATRVMMIASIK